MSPSEIMTIIIAFHMSHQRDFKNFYLGVIRRYYKSDFPALLSCTRFLEMMPSVLIPLSSYFTHLKGNPQALSSLIQPVSKYVITCAFQGTKSSKVLLRVAKERWDGFMVGGFKLYIIVNHVGDIVAAKLTPANVDDRKPVRDLSKGLLDKLCADKGYISKALTEDLKEESITLITT